MKFNNFKINGWLSFILVIITLLFVTLYFDVKHNNEILESRVNTLSSNLQKIAINDSITTAKIKEQAFKEDYYLKQLDRDTTLILWLIPVIIAIFGLFQFFNIKILLAGQAARQRSYNISQEEKYRVFEHNILGIKAKLGLDDYELLKKEAKNFYEKDYYSLYLVTYFRALSQKTTFYLINKKENNDITKIILSDYEKDLQEILDNIKNLDNKVKLSTDIVWNNQIKSIKEISNNKIDKLISEIKKNVIIEYEF
ncbi:hypothetical protein GW796_11340 [archaeon]|nr:hypothetical protein [archaeon]